MPTKTYQADTMMAALKLIQEEMGPQAIVVSVRDVHVGPAWRVWKEPGVEVVAMTPDTLSKAMEERNNKTPTIRPSANGKGIEFVEEKPLIEWDEPQPPAQKSPNSQPQGKPQRDGADSEARVWQPQHIQREKDNSGFRAALFRGDVPTASSRTGELKQELAFEGQELPAAPRPAPVSAAAPVQGLPAALSKLRQRLLSQGVEREFVESLVNVALEVMPAGELKDEERCTAFFRQKLVAELPVQSRLDMETGAQPIVLVGTSGSGKTSMTAKLAYAFSCEQGKQVTWVSADTIRTGAIAETRSFTDAIGVALRLVYAPADLPEVLAGCRNADVVLVDTPGYNPYSESQMVELGAVLTEIPDRATYLIASATTKDADLEQAIAALGLFGLKGIVITKLDETCTFGSIYNLARTSRLPLAFFSSGKEASGNFQPADAKRLVNALLGKGFRN